MSLADRLAKLAARATEQLFHIFRPTPKPVDKPKPTADSESHKRSVWSPKPNPRKEPKPPKGWVPRPRPESAKPWEFRPVPLPKFEPEIPLNGTEWSAKELECMNWSDEHSHGWYSKYDLETAGDYGMDRAEYTDAYYDAFLSAENHADFMGALRYWLVDVMEFYTSVEFADLYGEW